MTLLASPSELEPLASEPLRARFPQLGTAMDTEVMGGLLQGALLGRTGLLAEMSSRPKAEVDGDSCWIQYPLQLRTQSGESREVLVLGAMFAEPAAAGRFERDILAPLAARRRSHETPTAEATAVINALDMAVSVFPVNGLFPSLMDVTDAQRMSQALPAILASGSGPEVVGIDRVVFRRTRGCVLRYHLGDGADDPVVYGKVGSAASADTVREGLEGLHRGLGSRGGVPVHFPRLLGYSAELDLTLITSVPGSRPDLRDDSVLDAMVDKAAIVAAMHTSGVGAGRANPLEAELARSRTAVEEVRQDATVLAAWLTAVLDSVEAMKGRTEAQPPALAHCDFTLSQLLVSESGIGVLDFDDLGQAEPACDLGRFLASMRTVLAKSGNPSGDRLGSRFLDVYQAMGGDVPSVARLEVYAVTSLVRMAAHGWKRLKPSRLRLVCAVLEAEIGRLGLGPA